MAPTQRLSRRSLLLGSAGTAGLAFLAACSDKGTKAASGGSTLELQPDDGSKILIANFPYQGDYLVSGIEQRMVYLVGTSDGSPTHDTPGQLEFQITQNGQPVGAPIVVDPQSDGVPVPYYPVRATFAAPGTYSVATTLDDRPVTQSFLVSNPAEVALVQPGQPMRPVETPTLLDARGVDPICTRTPPCDLHTSSLTAALGTGRPVAFLVGTPEFCQTGICGPVLDLLIEQTPNYPGIEFIHAEVYTNAQATKDITTATVTPAVTTYGLTYEPALFLAGADGVVVARLDNAFDRPELKAGLDRLAA